MSTEDIVIELNQKEVNQEEVNQEKVNQKEANQKETQKKEDKQTTKKLVVEAYKAVDDKFGKDILILDISDISIMADYFIIATANNQTQLKAIADAIEEKLHKQGVKLRHSEGYQSSGWILLDFGCIVAHIFTEEEREFYSLERIWGDAQTVPIESLL